MKRKSITFKSISLLLGVVLFTSACGAKMPDTSDFKDISYTVKAGTYSSSIGIASEDNSNASTQEQIPDSSKSETRKKISSLGDDSEQETFQKDTDPTLVQNWKVLNNPNGFNINSVQNIQKFSCVSGRLNVSTFLPNVAYMEGGVAKGLMFDGFAFMGSNEFFYDYGELDGGKRAMTKKDWNNFIYTYEFREGYNMDALENTVGQVKTALEMPNYKVGVFGCIAAPVKRVTDWGEIGGKTLNFQKSDADRITALKWFVDEQIKVFNERNYKNLEFCGFYYYHESCTEEDMAFLPAITDYIRSRGYITVWSPYYLAKGYDKWKEFGFDRAAMQANYFPGKENLPNAGGKSNVSAAASITASRLMGMEMELCGLSAQNVSGIKEYFRVGVETKMMQRYHTWWLANGLATAKSLSAASDPYVQSAYREMYLFLNNSLQISDIQTQ